MDIINRMPPLLGMFEIVKFLDNRLVNPKFRDPDEYICQMRGFHNDVCYGLKYSLAYDKNDVVIKDSIRINNKFYQILFSCIKKKKKTRYYITFESYTSEPYHMEDPYDGPMCYTFTYKSLYVGNNIEKAIFCYLDYVSMYQY